MHTKISQLQTIYDAFERQVATYKAHSACGKGCAYCCTDAGHIHVTTLEGLAISEAVSGLTKPQQVKVKKMMAIDLKRREKGQHSACPFLMKNKACMIYTDRPFACRRIYSVKTCSSNHPPHLHRQVMAMGTTTIEALQLLDDTGYSGHLSFILYMLKAPRFRATYLAGEFKPEEVTDFGKSHRIIINKMVNPQL